MTTLRRSLRLRFGEVLHGFKFAHEVDEQIINDLMEQLSDAALTAIKDEKRPKINLAKADPFWALVHGEDIEQSALDENKIDALALETFERDMRVPDNWTWSAARGSEDKAWKMLRDFVVKMYREDQLAFQRYQTWRTQPYARGAMSNLAIKKNPENFPASWSDFLASSAMYGHKNTPTRPVETDDNGIPLSY